MPNKRSDEKPQHRASHLAAIVTDFPLRERFLMAISNACLPDQQNRIAMRLGLHFNSKTLKCNPSNELLMGKLGMSKSTLMRGLADLEAAGWVMRKRGGRDENVNYTLCIPSS